MKSIIHSSFTVIDSDNDEALVNAAKEIEALFHENGRGDDFKAFAVGDDLHPNGTADAPTEDTVKPGDEAKVTTAKQGMVTTGGGTDLVEASKEDADQTDTEVDGDVDTKPKVEIKLRGTADAETTTDSTTEETTDDSDEDNTKSDTTAPSTEVQDKESE